MPPTSQINLEILLERLLRQFSLTAESLEQQQRTLHDRMSRQVAGSVAGYDVRELIPLQKRVISGFSIAVEVYDLPSFEQLAGTGQSVRFSLEPPAPAPLEREPVRRLIPFLRPRPPKPAGTELRVELDAVQNGRILLGPLSVPLLHGQRTGIWNWRKQQ